MTMSTVWAWLLTYLVHSTVLLSAAWLASRWLAQRPRCEELVWRFAMVGAAITATCQAMSPAEPLAGAWHVAADAEPAHAALSSVPSRVVAEPIEPHAESSLDLADEKPLEPNARPSVGGSVAAHPTPAPRVNGISGAWAAVGWLTAACILSIVLAAAWYTLWRRLHSRVEITHGPLVETLTRLCRHAGLTRRVRLFCSSAIDGPLAMGFFRPQICVPPRAICELSSAQQELMLAHELGHVIRNDPAWQTLYRAIEWLAFFQPLHRLGRRRLEDLAEELADAWAAEQTGQGVTLAGLLVQVAEWLTEDRWEVSAVGMARRKSPLARRVNRLLAPAQPTVQPTTAPRALLAGLGLALIAAAACLPGVGLAGAAQNAPSRKLAPPDERRVEEAPAEAPPERRPLRGPPPQAELLSELGQLERDLAELAAEVRELRPLVASHPSGAALAPLVQRMSQQIERLQAQREVLWRIESQRR
jgi:beta-lactamase regulating signal transducer with metallopeptidase domain